MTYKQALVTGGSDGVGLSAARALVKAGYEVYFIGSNLERGKTAEVQLQQLAKDDQTIEFIQLDLSDTLAVKQFAGNFAQKHFQLDLLLFSAGVVLPKRQENPYGIEKTFSIGYLSAYVLAHALIPLLEQGDNPRVLTVSGGGPIVLKERLNFDDLNYQNAYNGFLAAANTVHAKVVLTQILAETLKEKGIDSNTFHPGVVKSGLTKNFPWPLSTGLKLASQLMPKDSPTAIHACLSEDLKGISGKFLFKKKIIPLKFSESYKDTLIEKTETILADI